MSFPVSPSQRGVCVVTNVGSGMPVDAEVCEDEARRCGRRRECGCTSSAAIAGLDLAIHHLKRIPFLMEAAYALRPSNGVIAIFTSSMPSMQLTFSATASVPSGFLPYANTSTPQSLQS